MNKWTVSMASISCSKLWVRNIFFLARIPCPLLSLHRPCLQVLAKQSPHHAAWIANAFLLHVTRRVRGSPTGPHSWITQCRPGRKQACSAEPRRPQKGTRYNTHGSQSSFIFNKTANSTSRLPYTEGLFFEVEKVKESWSPSAEQNETQHISLLGCETSRNTPDS